MKYEEALRQLLSFQNIQDRQNLILEDLRTELYNYKCLSSQNLFLFFELLGGNKEDIEPTHSWALEYTYDDFISDHIGDIPAVEDKFTWDLKKKSIDHAYATGIWYDTSLVDLFSKNDNHLYFEFDFCDGHLNDVIGNPYTLAKGMISHGFLLENI